MDAEAIRYVLIVDDDVDARDLLAGIVDMVGVPSKKATNGREALELIGESVPTLLFLDLMMPVMTGWEVVKYIQSDGRIRGRIKIVVVSGFEPASRSMLELPGVTKVIQKGGMKVSEMFSLINSLMG